MTTYMSKDLRDGLEEARIAGLRKASRLRVMAGDDVYPVLGRWQGGFSIEAAGAPHLRGLVDLYDGAVHLCQCLIVASEIKGGEMRFEFKRNTPTETSAALDFYREPDAPVARLTYS